MQNHLNKSKMKWSLPAVHITAVATNPAFLSRADLRISVVDFPLQPISTNPPKQAACSIPCQYFKYCICFLNLYAPFCEYFSRQNNHEFDFGALQLDAGRRHVSGSGLTD